MDRLGPKYSGKRNRTLFIKRNLQKDIGGVRTVKRLRGHPEGPHHPLPKGSLKVDGFCIQNLPMMKNSINGCSSISDSIQEDNLGIAEQFLYWQGGKDGPGNHGLYLFEYNLRSQL